MPFGLASPDDASRMPIQQADRRRDRLRSLLKDAGGLLQTMYLVATGMGLAPCAIGGGNAECSAAAAGTAFWEESSVADFMLGYAAGEAP